MQYILEDTFSRRKHFLLSSSNVFPNISPVFFSVYANNALQYTEQQNCNLTQVSCFQFLFPLAHCLGKENPECEVQLVTPLCSYQSVIIGHAILKSPPAFYAKELRPKETIRLCTAPSEIRRPGLKYTHY